MSRRTRVWFIGTLLLLGADIAAAVDRDWNQATGSHDFNDAANWTPSGAPGSEDNLTFGLDGDVAVLLDAQSIANEIAFTDGVVEFLGGGDLTVSDFEVSFETGSIAELLVSGMGTTAVINSVGSVGNRGTGLLSIRDGALVQIDTLQISKEAPGNGTVTVTGSSGGAPSSLVVLRRIDLGDPDDSGGTATLNINSGGRVTVNAVNGFRVAGATGGTATINVTGLGSLLESDETMELGDRGDGTLNVNTGASATSANVIMGQSSSSTGAANIDGAGSNWSVTGDLILGEFGAGELNVADGGLVNSNGGDIGFEDSSSTISSGTVNVSGGGSFWNTVAHGTNTLTVGNLGDGALNVTTGGRVDAHELQAGAGADSIGAANIAIDGSSSTVNVDQVTKIGITHAANLTIFDGGVLNTSTGGSFDLAIDSEFSGNGGSVVSVDGAGSQLNHQGTGVLRVGGSLVDDFAVAAQLNVTGGGAVSTHNLDVSLFPQSRGVVTVNGAGSRIDASNNITIGSQGEGRLIVGNGGVVAAQNEIDISEFRTDATATITGVGSHLTAGTSLGIAAFHPAAFNGFATGTLTIADGGTVSNTGNGQIAGRSANVGTVHVGDGGATATWNNGASLIVGGGNGNGSATLNINDGGIVNVVDTLEVNFDATVNLNGGELSTGNAVNDGRIDITDAATIDFDADNSGDGLINNAVLEIANASVSGNISNQGSFDIRGNVALAGDLTLDASGFIDFFVSGALSGEFGALAVAGDVTLGGDFDVSVIGGFTLTEGDVFEIIDVAGALSGTFADLSDGEIVGNFGGIELFIDYDAGDGNDVALITLSGLPGDYSNDGVVDAADYSVWRDNLGASAGALLNDADGGAIDTDQYLTWRTNYGATLPLATAAQRVPEPLSLVSLAMLCVCATMLALRERPA